MADKDNKKSTGYNSKFLSSKQTTPDNKSSVVNSIENSLDSSTLNILKDIAKNLKEISRDMQYSSRTKSSGERSTREFRQKRKVSKDSSIKLDKKLLSQFSKNQAQTNKTIKALTKLRKVSKSVNEFSKDSGIGDLTSLFTKSGWLEMLKEAVETVSSTASKFLSSSSILVDKNVRNLQMSMGISNSQANALTNAMDDLNISTSDLAYLTEGQQQALGDLATRYDKLYSAIDTEAITELSNAITTIKNYITIIKTTIITTIQQVLTILTPVLNVVKEALGQVIDILTSVLSSEVINNIIDIFKQLSTYLMSFIGPVIQGLLQIAGTIISSIATLINPFITLIRDTFKAYEPIIDLFKSIFSTISVYLSDIITNITNFLLPIVQTITNVLNDIVEPFLNIIAPVINWIKGFLIDLWNFNVDILQSILNAIIKPILNVLSWIYNAISWGDDIDLASDLQDAFNSFYKKLDKSDISGTYSAGNNVSTSYNSNSSKETIINATYNQNISGTAVNYADALSKANYNSNLQLANVVDGNS